MKNDEYTAEQILGLINYDIVSLRTIGYSDKEILQVIEDKINKYLLVVGDSLGERL